MGAGQFLLADGRQFPLADNVRAGSKSACSVLSMPQHWILIAQCMYMIICISSEFGVKRIDSH